MLGLRGVIVIVIVTVIVIVVAIAAVLSIWRRHERACSLAIACYVITCNGRYVESGDMNAFMIACACIYGSMRWGGLGQQR